MTRPPVSAAVARPATVSVIIPCYNAAPWLSECIDSALTQSHPPKEIIVVDDGSTDESAKIASGYGDRIVLLRQTNLGGNAARNIGLAQATGDYVQFLDADDLLLPEKLEHQVAAAEMHSADAVYGDWRHRYSIAGYAEHDGPAKLMGAQEDILLSLLDGWWFSPAALLVRRSTALAVGWDQDLQVAQDRDFITRLAMLTDRIVYVPRCDSIYRRVGAITVGTSNPRRFAYGHLIVSKKIEALLCSEDRLTRPYAAALARSYAASARQIARFDKVDAARVFRHARSLSATAAERQSRLFRALLPVVGYRNTESLYDWICAARKRFPG